MEIVVDNENRLVEVWVSSVESSMSETETKLKLICDKYSKIKFKTVVFRSGNCDLIIYTKALIRSNIMKFAKNDLNQMKHKI